MAAYCAGCGTKLSETESFCRHCGRAVASKPGMTATTDGTEAIRIFLTGLSRSDRVTAIGALVAMVAFFLPQYGYPDSAGFEIGGTYIIRFLAAVGILVLVYYRQSIGQPRRIHLACAQLALGSAYGIDLLNMFYGGELGVGYILLSAGFVTAAIGAYMSIVAETTRSG